MPDSHLFTLLFLGFLLGIRHALDADHVAAVMTLATGKRPLRRSALIGVCWGMGHTVILLIVGVAVVFFKLTISSAWAKVFEAGVGIMLVGLGVSLALALWRERLHLHSHLHEDGQEHRHVHAHGHGGQHDHLHRFRLEYKSLAVGMVHGLAGSAALLLLVLATVPSFGVGMLYIVVFGIGSILGMVLLATAMSIPFAMGMEKFAQAQQPIRIVSALLSIVIGSTILVESVVL
jgi:ABC-type nickel/cobalt efflux system permease component RcnA